MQGVLAVPIQGSIPLFLCGAALHLFATTSLGIFLATFARTMPQFALLMILMLLPLLSSAGGLTPRESMPEWVQSLMLAAPTTHFVMLAQGILYRGAGLGVVWPQFLALALIGTTLFGIALARFRQDDRDDGVGVALCVMFGILPRPPGRDTPSVVKPRPSRVRFAIRRATWRRDRRPISR